MYLQRHRVCLMLFSHLCDIAQGLEIRTWILSDQLLSQSASSVSFHNLQEYVYPDARDRQYLLFFHKGAKRTRFDIEKYNKLKDEIAEVQSLGWSWMVL